MSRKLLIYVPCPHLGVGDYCYLILPVTFFVASSFLLRDPCYSLLYFSHNALQKCSLFYLHFLSLITPAHILWKFIAHNLENLNDDNKYVIYACL